MMVLFSVLLLLFGVCLWCWGMRGSGGVSGYQLKTAQSNLRVGLNTAVELFYPGISRLVFVLIFFPFFSFFFLFFL